MAKRKPLDPRTLAAVARWHTVQAGVADALAADCNEANLPKAVMEAKGCAEAHRHAAEWLRNEAATIRRALKPAKRTKRR